MPDGRCYKCMHELSGTAKICPKCGFDNENPDQPSQALPCGTVLHDRYLIGKQIGQGGFGITYIGYDYTLKATVCIKEFFPAGGAMRSYDGDNTVQWSSGNTGSMLKRNRESFVREAQKAAKVRNLVSVVNVWDVFYENDTAYIVMEYIHGKTVKEYLMKRGTVMDIQECLSVFRPVMQDLQGVHEAGIVHRDISPDNMMIREDGDVKLLDLGAAKDLAGGTGQSSAIVQKRGFSPPEQYVEKGEIGPWTDVYAMCATIYWCMTGKVVPEALERLMGDTLRFPKTMPKKVAAVLGHGLELKQENRIRDFGTLMSELEQAAQGSDNTGTQKVPKTEKKTKPAAENPKELQTERGAERGTEREAERGTERRTEIGTERGAGRSVKLLPVALLAAIAVICIVFFVSRGGTTNNTNNLANDVRGETESSEAAIEGHTEAGEAEGYAALNGQAGQAAVEDGAEDGKDEATEEGTDSETPEKAAATEEKPISPSGTLNKTKFHEVLENNEIKDIEFLNTLEEVPSEAADLSEEGDGSVLAWIDVGKLYLAGEHGVKAPENCSYMFSDEKAFDSLFMEEDAADEGSWWRRLSNIYNAEYFDTSNTTDIYGMFMRCTDLTILDVSGWDTSKVENMGNVFLECYNLTILDVSGWDTSNAKIIGNLFFECTSLNYLDVSGWDTSKVEWMSGVFGACENLKKLSLRGWDTSNVTNMSSMFQECSSLQEIDIEDWNTSNVTDMGAMFNCCGSLKSLNLNKWDTSKVESMDIMFSNCGSLKELYISDWDTSAVTSMEQMFCNCSSLEDLDIGNWDTSSLTDKTEMFYGTSWENNPPF